MSARTPEPRTSGDAGLNMFAVVHQPHLMQNARRGLFYRSFFSSAESPCFVCDFVRFRSDPSASAVLYACDRYCGGLGRVLVLIIHAVCMCSYNKFTPRTSTRTGRN